MKYAWICLSFLLSAAPAATTAQVEVRRPSDVAAQSQAVEIPLTPYAGPLRTIAVKIGDVETSFLFDTGGGATVLSKSLAARVGCTPFGRGTGFRHDGTRVDGQRGTPVEMAIGPYARRGEVGVIDLDRLLQGLPPVGGIASLETFAGRAISIDLARGRLVLESAQSQAERVREARELKIRVAHQSAGASLDVFVAVEGKHGLLWFELDSGNVAPVLIAPHAFEELGIEPPDPDKTRAFDVPLAGFGPVKCEIASKEMIYDGLLNAEFFQRHVVTLDLASGRAWLRADS